MVNNSKFSQSFVHKLREGILTIDDQEEALNKPEWAYWFAHNTIGADIRKCEEVACKSPEYAYCFARCIPGADIRKCEEAAYKDPEYAHLFARYVIRRTL